MLERGTALRRKKNHYSGENLRAVEENRDIGFENVGKIIKVMQL